MRILTTPSKDIDTVLDLFSRDKGAYVGYSSCDAPFYLLLTDCVRTLRRLVSVHPRFFRGQGAVRARQQASATGSRAELRARNGRHRPPDTISTVGLFDPDPTSGSVMLYAGWQVDGEYCGAPNEGYVPVPEQLLRAVVNDPTVAYWFGAAPRRRFACALNGSSGVAIFSGVRMLPTQR